MSIEIKILRKKGWKLNDNDNTVNKILQKLHKNNYRCPTEVKNRKGHNQCPCASYLEDDICFCKLYVKKDDVVQKDPWGW